MQYLVEDEAGTIHGPFNNIEALGLFMDDVRNRRGDRYKQLPRYSTFDYISSIGWFLTIKE
tara:strand:- start:932 stop:1114 length:183 start_codon:yes stop_codon:yes gene_type:complete